MYKFDVGVLTSEKSAVPNAKLAEHCKLTNKDALQSRLEDREGRGTTYSIFSSLSKYGVKIAPQNIIYQLSLWAEAAQ